MRRGTTCAGERTRERGKEGVVLCVCIERAGSISVHVNVCMLCVCLGGGRIWRLCNVIMCESVFVERERRERDGIE